MTGQIIPADRWPEGAVALVWDQHGKGKALVMDEPQKSWFLVYVSTPMPAGHDWRVPVMRPVAEAKPAAWWNGVSPSRTGNPDYDPSVRWGADAEDDWHDIPLYAGRNPVHYQQPDPATDLEQFRVLAQGGIDALNESMFGNYQTALALRSFKRLLALIDGQDRPASNQYRERSTHHVYRGSVGNLPCHCWANDDHVIGDEQPSKGEGVSGG